MYDTYFLWAAADQGARSMVGAATSIRGGPRALRSRQWKIFRGRTGAPTVECVRHPASQVGRDDGACACWPWLPSFASASFWYSRRLSRLWWRWPPRAWRPLLLNSCCWNHPSTLNIEHNSNMLIVNILYTFISIYMQCSTAISFKSQYFRAIRSKVYNPRRIRSFFKKIYISSLSL